MCDCAEEAERRRRLQQNKQSQAGESHRSIGFNRAARGGSSVPPFDLKKVLGASALLCGLLALTFGAFDRKTIKRILTMIGLGWLISGGDSSCDSVPPEDSSKCLPKKSTECCRCACKYTTV